MKIQNACIAVMKKNQSELGIPTAVVAAIEEEMSKDEWEMDIKPYLDAERAKRGAAPMSAAEWDVFCLVYETTVNATYSTRCKGLPNDVIKRAEIVARHGETRVHIALRTSETGRPRDLPLVRVVCSKQTTVDEEHIPPSSQYKQKLARLEKPAEQEYRLLSLSDPSSSESDDVEDEEDD
jgi:hypothetical protein